MTTPTDAYDLIDRFLRNNLSDDDYAEYSAALETLRISQAGAGGEPVAWRYRMEGDLQWQYTERQDQTSHATYVERIYTAPPPQAVREQTQDCGHESCDCRRYCVRAQELHDAFCDPELPEHSGCSTKGGQHGAE